MIWEVKKKTKKKKKNSDSSSYNDAFWRDSKIENNFINFFWCLLVILVLLCFCNQLILFLQLCGSLCQTACVMNDDVNLLSNIFNFVV